jgi:hypothetical protein
VLTNYLNLTSRLLQNPPAPTSLYTTADLSLYINIARGQLAGETRCIRLPLASINTVIGQRNYNFSAINIGTPSANGIQGILHIRRIMYQVGQGYKWMEPRSSPWFDLYYLNNPVPVPGPPKRWAQYGQGASGVGSITGVGAGTMASGNFLIDPIPDYVYGLFCDVVCYPIALAADTDVEAIPYEWTDAVPYYAAYMALLSSQTSARMGDAERYLNYYNMFVQRARNAATPDVNKYLYEQTPDPTALAQMGLPTGKAATQ